MKYFESELKSEIRCRMNELRERETRRRAEQEQYEADCKSITLVVSTIFTMILSVLPTENGKVDVPAPSVTRAVAPGAAGSIYSIIRDGMPDRTSLLGEQMRDSTNTAEAVR